jgi:hypothetical protein
VRRIAVASLLSALLLPLGAGAQDAAPQLQADPRTARFSEVERGFYAGLEVGFLGITKTPVSDPVRYPFACLPGSSCSGGFASGLALTIDLGYDITARFAASVFWMQAFQAASDTYGSFGLGMGGLGLRYAFVALDDSNGVERFYTFVRARGAYVFTYPQGLFGTTDWMAGGGLGVEYYTRLRHFSVGLVLDGLYFVRAAAPAFDVLATLRYTF